jgi:hypothetical protein
MSAPIPDSVETAESAAEALKRGELSAALRAFATGHLLTLREPVRTYSDHDINGFGATLWLMGDTRGAGFVWSRTCDEAYKGRFTHSASGTFQSGLLLWFASVWLKNQVWRGDAERLLEKLLRKKQPVMGAEFPSHLAKLVRGETDAVRVAAEYDAAPSHLRERRKAQTMFYAGVREVDLGNSAEAQRLWQQIGSPENPLVELEYYLLVHERQRNGG